ncbi:MAG: right-handed parallel beta-helix repeat-containing protein [Kiritimatiellae bacterium]|nr:right-handed parallel beta-helix repeat-containing protein [Kiritimatiellia bacterium]
MCKKTGKLRYASLMLITVFAFNALRSGAEEYRMDETERTHSIGDSYRYDLRPGLRVACRVRFDAPIEEQGQATILQKGGANSPGSFILRVDGPKEGVKFSFFVNLAGTPEPRVFVPIKPVPGEWYEVAAGWDGTNSWITVNGQTATRRRPGGPAPIGCVGELQTGPMLGTVADPAVTGPAAAKPQPDDLSIAPGFRISCTATFLAPPEGETTIAYKREEYWLRYDRRKDDAGAFNFFVLLDGKWEPRSSFMTDVELGRAYRLSAGWDGAEVNVSVDTVTGNPSNRGGRCKPSDTPLLLGTEGKIAVTDFCIRNERKPIVSIGEFRTRELMPTVGVPATLLGTISNIGTALTACTLEASPVDGAKVSPGQVALDGIGEYVSIPLEWAIDPGTNGIVHVDFILRQGEKVVAKTRKRIIFMPEKEPALSAKAWNPPVTPGRTFHVDSKEGDDSRDGLTPATAWKTFANAANLTLGPGERLLLKRGSVFTDELQISARGAPGNWAEIGAYGEGMRPQIRRARSINDRCGFVLNPAYLAVRDLIFCNAGSGFSLICEEPGSGHLLVERCLSHHIEGIYRFNSHGIPEWRDARGAPGPGGSRSCGIYVGGSFARHTVLRDCESYQCSSGFSVNGLDAYVTRMFCHDNYAHNTSPHPYNCTSRSWMTDSVFDASGWHAAAGTMGVMLGGNCGFVIRGCHFLNQPDSGSPDQGGIDFECGGENCRVEECTFRNNAGASIEVLGLIRPQTRNVHIRRCKFDRNNYSRKNGPAEIQVWGGPDTPTDIACSNGLIEDNGYVLIPGIPFYVNNSPTTNDWVLSANREFDFADELDRAYPAVEPPVINICGEIWTDRAEAALAATVSGGNTVLEWEQTEGPAGVAFKTVKAVCTKADFPTEGDYRIALKADNGTFWRTARTAVHVLPNGARTFRAWDFAKNLDMQGWRVENAGTDYEFLRNKMAFWNSKSHPVRLVCGDYLVIALKETAEACIVTPDEMDVGVQCSATRANAMRIKMQNHTDSKRMRLWWQTNSAAPLWEEKNTIAFDVTAMDGDDTIYTVSLPPIGNLKQLKLAFSADGKKVTGTCRIDYIWLGSLPKE